MARITASEPTGVAAIAIPWSAWRVAGASMPVCQATRYTVRRRTGGFAHARIAREGVPALLREDDGIGDGAGLLQVCRDPASRSSAGDTVPCVSGVPMLATGHCVSLGSETVRSASRW
jgi:hypothetical protein